METESFSDIIVETQRYQFGIMETWYAYLVKTSYLVKRSITESTQMAIKDNERIIRCIITLEHFMI